MIKHNFVKGNPVWNGVLNTSDCCDSVMWGRHGLEEDCREEWYCEKYQKLIGIGGYGHTGDDLVMQTCMCFLRNHRCPLYYPPSKSAEPAKATVKVKARSNELLAVLVPTVIFAIIGVIISSSINPGFDIPYFVSTGRTVFIVWFQGAAMFAITALAGAISAQEYGSSGAKAGSIAALIITIITHIVASWSFNLIGFGTGFGLLIGSPICGAIVGAISRALAEAIALKAYGKIFFTIITIVILAVGTLYIVS